MSKCQICMSCGNCVKACKYCGKVLRTDRKSKDLICDKCLGKED